MDPKYLFLVLTLMLIIESLYCFEAKEFRCKPRPGCHIAQCDAGPTGIDNFLQRNEYPIKCHYMTSEVGEEFVTRQDYNKLFGFYKKSRDEIVSLMKGITWSF